MDLNHHSFLSLLGENAFLGILLRGNWKDHTAARQTFDLIRQEHLDRP